MSAADGAPSPCPNPRKLTRWGVESHVRCGRRGCGSCGVLWLRDTSIRTLAAVQAHAAPVALVTVTAPGADVLPWDDSGRRVDARAAADWNRDAPANWTWLHRAAARDARRVASDWGVCWRLLVKSWEYQKRGVLHLHLLVPCATRGEFEASSRYVAHLAENAHAYGFGFVDRGKLPESGGRRSARQLTPVDAHRAAAYVSGYLASTGAGKGGVAEVAQKQGVPGAVVYCAQALTQRSGVTMRSLRDRRRIACRYPDAVADPDAWDAACLCDAIERGSPPITGEHRAALLAVALAQGWTHAQVTAGGPVRCATTAPAPGHSCRDRAERIRARRTERVRLDSVLHRCHDGTLRWVSIPSWGGHCQRFDTEQEEERGRRGATERTGRWPFARVPSDA